MSRRKVFVFLLAAALADPLLAETKAPAQVDLYVEVDPGETTLEPGNFMVREDGVSRSITAVEPAGPASLVLLIENSGRSWEVLNETRSAMRAFLRHAPGAHSYALVSFGRDARVESALSAEVLDAAGAYAEMKQSAWNDADTFDAVSRTLRAAGDTPAPRAILLIGGGRDSFSRTSYRDLIRQAEAADVIIHTILTGGSLDEQQAEQVRSSRGEMLHRALAAQTGGRHFCPNCEAGYSDAMQDALDALSRLYLVRYERPEAPQPGFVELEVEAFLGTGERRAKLPVRSRKGWRIEP